MSNYWNSAVSTHHSSSTEVALRGAGTVSGQGGQRFLEKNSAQSAEKFFSLPTLVISLPTLDFIAWVGKDPLAIT